ncbi:hypothetical protein [Hymenobacter guriensis]|nr:hypothetical protein [Hymenobacter guriensis]
MGFDTAHIFVREAHMAKLGLPPEYMAMIAEHIQGESNGNVFVE